jgi:hypothetical protein
LHVNMINKKHQPGWYSGNGVDFYSELLDSHLGQNTSNAHWSFSLFSSVPAG